MRESGIAGAVPALVRVLDAARAAAIEDVAVADGRGD